jgi:hypothetical protein
LHISSDAEASAAQGVDIWRGAVLTKPLLAGMIVMGCIMAAWSLAIMLRLAPKFF